jgi:hypothetical protein
VKAVLCDINVILDIFLEREPFYTPAAQIFAMISAVNASVDCLITRNRADYTSDILPVMTPEEFLSAIEA